MEYGLIGYPLKHSFSKFIHDEIKQRLNPKYNYQLQELNENDFSSFMEEKPFLGINVTIPYKEKVIPYLDEVSPLAKRIKAVNTIVNHQGHLIGYNTDYYGLKMIIESLNILQINCALILGTGGTSKTASIVLEDLQVKEYKFVSRKKSSNSQVITYEDLKEYYHKCDLIINTTPLGMYPNNDTCPISLSSFTSLKGVCDVIFNPLRTKMLIEADTLGIPHVGGLLMLCAQAVYAYRLFTNHHDFDALLVINDIYNKLLKTKSNIVLIGMPGCGKTRIAKELAKRLKTTYLDTDDLIKDVIKCEISEYFKTHSEAEFRDIESNVIKSITPKNGLIIATGGGAILREENVQALKQNGTLYFINRSLSLIRPTASRPLSSDVNSLKQRYLERLPIYRKVCDIEINGDLEIEDKCQIIMEGKHENSNLKRS